MKTQSNAKLLWAFILIYIFYFGLISIMKFNSYGYYDFDLAVHVLSVWNILHGSIFNSILGIPFLGNHMHIILFFIAPLYAVFSHPLTLLFLQTIALGLAALPLYRLSEHLLGGNWALIISIIYLFYPALGYTNLFEFHPTVFATFFLMLTFYYYEQKSFLKFVVFMVLSMLCQENMPLAVVMFGVLAIFNHRKLKWIVSPIFIGSLYLFIALSVMSYFNNNTIQFIAIYRHLGRSPQEIIFNTLTEPSLLLKTLVRKESFTYLLQIFLPLSFLPLLSPAMLLPALPFFLQHMFSRRASDLTIFYHYTAEIIPFVFIGFIYAIKFLLNHKWLKQREKQLKTSLLFILFVSNIFLGPHFKILPRLISLYSRDYLDVYKDAFIAKIPKPASVVATFEFLPHLSHRKSLYSLHHAYSGFYTLSNKRYELPSDAEYALIDFNDSLTFFAFYGSDNYKNLQRLLSQDNWKVLDSIETIVLFKKDTSVGPWLYQTIQDLPLELEHKTQINIDDDLELIGYSLNRLSRENILEIIFYWKCLKVTTKDISMFLDIVDINDNLTIRKFRPIGYRVFPTNSWKKGQIFKERYRLYIPSIGSEGNYKLKIGFFDYRTGLLCKTNGPVDNFGRVFLTDIK